MTHFAIFFGLNERVTTFCIYEKAMIFTRSRTGFLRLIYDKEKGFFRKRSTKQSLEIQIFLGGSLSH